MTETLRKETSTPINRNTTTQSTTSIPQINPDKKRFPYCIVWTPLPLITSLIPCIGHTGICSSEGITHDFAGSYVVGVDNLSFGETHKYVQLEPNENEKQKWDEAIKRGDIKFNKEEHNLLTNNCHSHCAYVLNQMNYKGRSNYTMVDIFLMVNSKSRYVSYIHVIKTYIMFVIICIIMYVLYSKTHI
jgi:hypothetical protein